MSTSGTHQQPCTFVKEAWNISAMHFTVIIVQDTLLDNYDKSVL